MQKVHTVFHTPCRKLASLSKIETIQNGGRTASHSMPRMHGKRRKQTHIFSLVRCRILSFTRYKNKEHKPPLEATNSRTGKSFMRGKCTRFNMTSIHGKYPRTGRPVIRPTTLKRVFESTPVTLLSKQNVVQIDNIMVENSVAGTA